MGGEFAKALVWAFCRRPSRDPFLSRSSVTEAIPVSTLESDRFASFSERLVKTELKPISAWYTAKLALWRTRTMLFSSKREVVVTSRLVVLGFV